MPYSPSAAETTVTVKGAPRIAWLPIAAMALGVGVIVGSRIASP